MWKFTKYGFFSIGRVKTSYGIGNGSLLESINPDRLYIRARWNEHLTALQLRFAQLSTLRIEQTPDRDYPFRLTVLKPVWLHVLNELAEEQTWPDFKGEVATFQEASDSEYTRALHGVWALMKDFQDNTKHPGRK